MGSRVAWAARQFRWQPDASHVPHLASGFHWLTEIRIIRSSISLASLWPGFSVVHLPKSLKTLRIDAPDCHTAFFDPSSLRSKSPSANRTLSNGSGLFVQDLAIHLPQLCDLSLKQLKLLRGSLPGLFDLISRVSSLTRLCLDCEQPKYLITTNNNNNLSEVCLLRSLPPNLVSYSGSVRFAPLDGVWRVPPTLVRWKAPGDRSLIESLPSPTCTQLLGYKDHLPIPSEHGSELIAWPKALTRLEIRCHASPLSLPSSVTSIRILSHSYTMKLGDLGTETPFLRELVIDEAGGGWSRTANITSFPPNLRKLSVERDLTIPWEELSLLPLEFLTLGGLSTPSTLLQHLPSTLTTLSLSTMNTNMAMELSKFTNLQTLLICDFSGIDSYCIPLLPRSIRVLQMSNLCLPVLDPNDHNAPIALPPMLTSLRVSSIRMNSTSATPRSAEKEALRAQTTFNVFPTTLIELNIDRTPSEDLIEAIRPLKSLQYLRIGSYSSSSATAVLSNFPSR